ncbi:HEC/Ndc80p family-domain containing protein [Nitzschia inconspicua]|uniref:Kinetochore protein NDC80 n=1 Tax=Nitzschia inconspicua TaxID=303405 RepID=A0A9K3L1L0_9STRA|nr:HEC/Ndc80p family-domain containing protein [Nitzschia inconspicua]
MIPRVGRENVVPPTPPSVQPPSSASSNRRRSSIGGGGGGGGGGDRRQSMLPPGAQSKPDPRPITDKAYQQDCIKKLLVFLQRSGYDHPISQKSLSRPSGKDFTNIITFMLRKVDPTFQDGTLKIEDEIAMNFKAMGYPFTVSKTALVAAGSPHTWPTLLAALTWLMMRIQCMEDFSTDEDPCAPGDYESLEELETKMDKYFFRFLSESYSAFLKGDEKLKHDLEIRLGERFEHDDAYIMQECDDMTDRNGAIVEKMAALNGGEKELEELIQKRDSYKTDLEQFHDLIQQMNQHVATLTQKRNDRAKELEETNVQLSKLTERVSKLKDTITRQEMSVDDVRKMQSELKGVEEATERAIALRDQRRSSLWEIESELENTWTNVESLVSDYNTSNGELGLLPLVSSRGLDMKVVIDKSAAQHADPTRLLSVDLQGTVQPTLLSLREEYGELSTEFKQEYQQALDDLELSEEAFTEAMEKHRIVDGKIDKCEETMEAEREVQEAKLGVRTREVESLETKVASLRDPVALEEQMAQFERQCAELEAMRQQHEEDNLARKRAICVEIDQACSAMEEYDQFCLQKIADVNKYRDEKRSTYGELRLPKTDGNA